MVRVFSGMFRDRLYMHKAMQRQRVMSFMTRVGSLEMALGSYRVQRVMVFMAD